MTLPFRRRHHDLEAPHDRARAIAGGGFETPPSAPDAAWLAGHLEGCGECRREIEGWSADRELLRGLRATAPEPPRDLWARTSAAIERESGRRERTARPYGGPRIGRMPVGAASGIVVVLVVVATSLLNDPQIAPTPGDTPRPTTDTAVVTPPPEATPLAVAAEDLTWVQRNANGTYALVIAPVDRVCTESSQACAPLQDTTFTTLTLDVEPESITLSPEGEQLVMATSSDSGGEVRVVPVPTAGPTGGPTDSPPPTDEATTTPDVTASPVVTLAPSETPPTTNEPGVSPSAEPRDGGHSILTGVEVVGEAAYSASGEWLAFAARPLDGTAGPDLYTWRTGDLEATRVSTDGRTFFAGWLGDLVLASRVVSGTDVDPNASPTPSDGAAATTAAPTATAKPGRTPKPQGTAVPTEPGASVDPNASPAPEDRPVSFLLDPATGGTLELAGQDIWRPVVDPTSRSIVYWRGTLVRDAAGTGWALGTGELVLDGWVDPYVPPPSPDPDATLDPDATVTPRTIASLAPDASLDPLASPEPTLPPGPAGTPTVLESGVDDFDASFDPEGLRLALWIPDAENPGVGTLRLIVIDPETGGVDEDVDPLPGVSSLRGFSIDRSRLAWVTPPGQDGDASHVQVLAWKGDEFGQVRSLAIDRLFVTR